MKRYIFTETQMRKLIDNVVSEQITSTPISKFPFAFDNTSTDFQGEIKNGFLYITLENEYKGKRIFKIGPVKTSKLSKGMVTITKKNGTETVTLGGHPILFQDGFKVMAVG